MCCHATASSSTRRQGDSLPFDAHPVAGMPLRDALAPGATAHPHLVALAVDHQHDPIGAGRPLRFPDHRHPSGERSELVGRQRGPRRIAPPHRSERQRGDGDAEAQRPHDSRDRTGGDRHVPPPRGDRDGHRDGCADHVCGPRGPQRPNPRMPRPGGRLAVASSHRALNHVSTRVRRPALVPAAHPQPRPVPRRGPTAGARRHLPARAAACSTAGPAATSASSAGSSRRRSCSPSAPRSRTPRCTRSASP